MTLSDGPSAPVTAAALPPSLELLLGALGEGVYGLDEEGRATFFNAAACRLLGYAAGEILGRRQHDLLHRAGPGDESISPEACLIYAVLKDGRTRRVSNEYFRHRDGRCFPVEYTATAIMDHDRVTGAVVVFRDISDRLESERALRHAHEAQRALMENLPDAAWMKDAELRYVAVNEAFVQGTGLPRESFIGRTVHDLLPREEAERYDEADRRILESGETGVVEEPVTWRGEGGRPRWIETIRKPIAGPDGPAGLVGIARDVTEWKRREEAGRFLAEAGQVIISSLAWMETLHGVAMLVVPRMGDWCVASVFDSQGGVESVEVRAADRAREERLRELVARHPNAYGPENDLVGRVMLNGQGERLETLAVDELESLAGAPEEVERLSSLDPRSALVVPLTVETRTTGVLILVRGGSRPPFDPTDLLLVEEVARRAALAIEHARQHRLANEALRARDEVLRIVAHDLRGLVASVELSTRVLESADLPEHSRRTVAGIGHATQRMQRLVRDILDVSRVESGWLPLDPGPVDANVLLREALEGVEPVARDRGVELITEPSQELPPVRADKARALQVLGNLLGNAVEFTPGGGQIRVKAKRLGNEVVFCVKDTGPGIPSEDLPHVFDRFWRARRAPAGGAGLGLAIARGIVGAHGGRIWAASEVGQGSRFCFTLPLVDGSPHATLDGARAPGATAGPPDGKPSATGQPSAQPTAPNAPVASGAAEPLVQIGSHPGRPVRVLVVDDHQAIRDGVRAILKAAPGVEVVDESAHGEEAIRKVRILDPDVVVMDLSLPGMDGFEAMRRIGELGRRVRILVLTAHAPEKSLIKAMEAGACGFVRKATAHQDLIPALRTVLQGEVFLDAHSNHVLVRTLERALEARRRLATLTEHEREIVQLTAEGYTAQEIGGRIFLSPHTVASYRSQAMRKLGLEHRSDLVHFALETELIGPE